MECISSEKLDMEKHIGNMQELVDKSRAFGEEVKDNLMALLLSNLPTFA